MWCGCVYVWYDMCLCAVYVCVVAVGVACVYVNREWVVENPSEFQERPWLLLWQEYK